MYCNRKFSNKGGLGAHQPYCKVNPNRVQRAKSINAHRKKGSTSKCKGTTKLQNPNLARPMLHGVRFGASLVGHTEETKQKLSIIAKERKLGGYVQGSGRGKKGWYKGFFCDSSWELAYVIYCLEHNIDIKRNTEKRKYIWNGEVKNYIPDFIVDGVLTEIKGYKTEQWMAKLNANPDIKVLYEADLEVIITYVTNTYGKDFIKLYEKPEDRDAGRVS